MTGDPGHAAPTDADTREPTGAATPAAHAAVERPVLHSDGVVCA